MPSAPPDVCIDPLFDSETAIRQLLDDATDPWLASYASLEKERDLAYGQLYRTTADVRRLLAERDAALAGLSRAHHQTLLRLAMAAELKDGDTGKHVVRLGVLSCIVARAVGQDETFARRLGQAAPMHDIGKIGVPDAVLKKPGPLTSDEWVVMRRHPEIGASLLAHSGIPLFDLAAEVALAHHEKWDGTGYPQGLAAEAIPLSARVVALVDFFDALTMDRVYRPRMADGTAIALVCEQRGRHFDPELVDAFLGCVDRLVAAREDINRRDVSLEDLLDTGF